MSELPPSRKVRLKPSFVYVSAIADFWERGWKRSCWRHSGQERKKRDAIIARYLKAKHRREHIHDRPKRGKKS